ncbi:leucine-rich repeats and immunoglobulin-like domains protein 1 [Ptychodera flava]|uniref:leucine-rich repeats and immunoglobulin-like domains protein 1 n=1 Tax=Ptychodera flava TaxID=63121 RepID=UPI00396A28E8
MTLTCTTSRSNPASTITWYKNGSPLKGHSNVINITTITEESSGHSGFITKEQLQYKVTPSDNAAKIQCSASLEDFPDEMLIFSKEITMSIFFPPNHPENCLTQLTKTTQGTELIVNQSLTLQCTSCSSNPPADILWYMDDREMKSSNQAEHSDGYFNGTVSEEKLHLNLSYKHKGRSIHCVATSRIFSGQTYESKKINLDVHYAPFPADEKITRRVAVSVGKTASLQCQMKGNPTLSIKWYDQDRSELQPDDNRRYIEEDLNKLMQESTLYIKNVSYSDYGIYYCRGENKHGDVEIVIILSKKSVPDAVTNIEIHMQADVANVHWTAGFNGGDGQKFYVEYVKLPEGVTETTEVISDNKLGEISVNISGLVEGSRYNITVVSKNDIGENRSRALTLMVEESNNETTVTLQPSITLFVIVSSCAVVVLVVIVAVPVVYVIRRRNKANLRHMTSSHSYESINNEGRCHGVSERSNDEMDEPVNYESIPLNNIVTEDSEIDCTSSGDQTSDAYKDLEVRKTSQTYMKPGEFPFEFPSDRLHITETLYTSTFFRIVKGIAWFIDGKDGPSAVAIKTEIKSKDPQHQSDLLQE